MKGNKWMDNPAFSGISDEKLEILTKIIEGAENKSPKEMITYFLKSTKEAAGKGIYFNNEETDLIVNVLKENMTPEEIKKLDTLRKMSQIMSKKF